jgi:hypothetical protein
MGKGKNDFVTYFNRMNWSTKLTYIYMCSWMWEKILVNMLLYIIHWMVNTMQISI